MGKVSVSAKDSALAFICSFIFYQLALFVFAFISLSIASMFNSNASQFESFLDSATGVLLQTIVTDITLLLVFLFFNIKKDNKIIEKPKTNKIFIYILIAIVCFFAINPFLCCIDSLLLEWGVTLKEFPYTLTNKNLVLSIFSFAILPPVFEELLFRGLIFKGLKKHGKVFSIMLTSIMFAIFHMSYQQLIYPILFSMLLSVIMYYENNIIYCIIIHAVNNFLSLMLAQFDITLFVQHWAFVLFAILLVVIYLVVVLYFVIKNNKAQEKQPIGKQNLFYLLLSLLIMIVIWVIINFVA